MSGTAPQFKRIVLGLPHSSLDYAGVHAVAEFAELLRLGLLATFVEDAGLARLGGLPCVRELQPLGGGWRPIEATQLSHELEGAAEAARRLFADAVRSRRIDAEFSVARGPDLLGGLLRADDIVGIIEPQHPAERITRQFTRLLDTALRATSAVMLVPGRLAWRGGPIVAIVAGPDDPSIAAGLVIAARAKERLVVVSATGRPISSPQLDLAASAGTEIEHVIPAWAPVQARNVAAVAAGLRGRLLLVTRGVLGDAAVQAVAASRKCPVLVVEPTRPSAPAAEPPPSDESRHA